MLIELLTQIILKINTIRTQLELWQVVKDNFDEYFSFGLCQLIDSLRYVGKINHYEGNSLREELSLHGDKTTYFLGLSGNPKPRLEFTEKMIKKHSENAITENK